MLSRPDFMEKQILFIESDNSKKLRLKNSNLVLSDDKNKMPIRLQADLAVGSIKADIDAYKGLKHPFKIIVD